MRAKLYCRLNSLMVKELSTITYLNEKILLFKDNPYENGLFIDIYLF